MSTDATTEAPPAGDGEGGEEQRIAWLADADEQTVEYLASRGWDKDPKGLLSSQREAEAALRREQQARASMEAELAEAREYVEMMTQQQGGQQQGPSQEDPFGLAAAAAAYENGDINMATLVQYQNAAVLQAAQQMMDGRLAERVDPIANRQVADTLERTAAEIAGSYPDFAELSDDVLELMQRHPAKYGDAEGMWAAYGLVKSKRQVAESQQRAAAQGAETLDTGGRARATLDAAEALKKQLREMGDPRPGL